MLLIATDEAGYGPKLGPLVVAASVGRIGSATSLPKHDEVIAAFQPMAVPVCIGTRKVRIDDSKSVYKSGAGLAGLHHVVSASHHWCGHSLVNTEDMIRHVAPVDLDYIAACPWLRQIESQRLTSGNEVTPAIDQWRAAGFSLLDIQARVITAKRFNQSCRDGRNKADLLTESTLGLVERILHQHANEEDIRVFCDRHGGRRYYANAIAERFPNAKLQVVSETKIESVYQCVLKDRQVRFAFTVKGDRFAPVALSSMHAKYLREYFMNALNSFFLSRHQGEPALKPTAGYPVDADRYLRQISEIVERERIESCDLVRTR